jgi:hypothetical protein
MEFGWKEPMLAKGQSDKPVAFRDNVVATESLPLPVVRYPGFYGAFFGFQKDGDSPLLFCSCAEEAIENYVWLKLSESRPRNSVPAREFVVDSGSFPRTFVERCISDRVSQDLAVLSAFQYADKICHECNHATPSFRYCVEMYGGVFKQTYGWYINKQAFEWGIHPLSLSLLNDRCPQEVRDLIEVEPLKAQVRAYELSQAGGRANIDEARTIHSDLGKQSRRIYRLVENEVRCKFGHKRVGDAWTSETILYHLVRSIFSGHNVKRHHRPEWLAGLELDIYIEDLLLAIEYQGVQHFEPVKHWGGAKALKLVQERDRRKARICRDRGVSLVYFTHEDGLSERVVRERLLKNDCKPT